MLKKEPNVMWTRLHGSQSFCALHPKRWPSLPPLERRTTAGEPIAGFSEKASRLRRLRHVFPVSMRASTHARTYARTRAPALANQRTRRRSVQRRGGATFYTCARLGGPLSFSPSAADMVSIPAAGSGVWPPCSCTTAWAGVRNGAQRALRSAR